MNFLCESPSKARRNRQRVQKHQNISAYLVQESARTGYALDDFLPPELAGELPEAGLPKGYMGFCQPFEEGE